MSAILFIGNFLSRSEGSYSVSEFIADKIKQDEFKVFKASHARNRVLRFSQILLATSFKRYAVLHIDVFSGNSFLFARTAAWIGKRRNKKIVLTLHGGALHEFYRGREAQFEGLFKNAAVQSPSSFLQSFFSKNNLRVTYSPNPIYLDRFSYQQCGENSMKLLWVRAFSTIYNPHIPILILERIQKQYPLATLTMIGPDKGLLEETQKFTSHLGLSGSVYFLGPIPNHQLADYYHSHTVYLNTPSYESFGIAVVEAASCGIPVVSFRVGEIPYLWRDEENILLAPLHDVDEMSAQVARLFNDQELRNRISIKARRCAEKFSWEHIRPHWIKLLRE